MPNLCVATRLRGFCQRADELAIRSLPVDTETMKSPAAERTKSKREPQRIPAGKLRALAVEFMPKAGTRRWSAAEFLRQLRAK